MKSGSKPLTWVSGNVVYGRSMRDPWAVLVLGSESHDCAEQSSRLSSFDAFKGALVELAADVQILRVHRFWDQESYREQQEDEPTPHVEARARYLDEQVDELDGAWGAPMVVLAVSLSQAKAHTSERAGEALADPRGQLEETRAAMRGYSMGSWARSQEAVEADHDRADEVLARVCAFLPETRAASLPEVEWLVRRAWTRGIGEPVVDGLDEPRALVFERNGSSVLRPESVDLLAWTDYVHRGYRQLRVEGELGTSWQTGLIASSLPGDAPEASAALELLFGPQDRLGFGVDLALCCRYVSPSRAARAVDNERARADEAAREEDQASRGASDRSLMRTEVARDAEAYLTGGMPLFEATLSVIVAAVDERSLSARVRETISVFRAYGVNLRQPVGQQLQVFFEHLPAQRSWTTGFIRRVTADQLAAMAPRAAHRLGGRRGYVWGTVGQGAAASLARWCPQDGPRLSTAAGVLFVGDSGSGKTVAAGKLTTEAFLDGHRIFNSTAKPDDHHWFSMPAIAPHVDVIKLDADHTQWRGLLDPWLNAPRALRRDAAKGFLESLLPHDVPHTWQTQLLAAVDVVETRSLRPSNVEVLEALEQRGEIAMHIAEHLRVQSRSGLAQLGFADRIRGVREISDRQITHMQLENIPTPEAGVSRGDYDDAERMGSALIKLVALLGLGILDRHPDEAKIFNFDEVKALLDHASGRKIIDQLQRLGRSKKAVPVLQTQYATDIGIRSDSVGELFGSVWAFRSPNEEQAVRSLELLGRAPTSKLVRDLTDKSPAHRGRALVRDHRGQVEWVQVTLPSSLLHRVNTNPTTRKQVARA